MKIRERVRKRKKEIKMNNTCSSHSTERSQWYKEHEEKNERCNKNKEISKKKCKQVDNIDEDTIVPIMKSIFFSED